jgi:hypothetical protein
VKKKDWKEFEELIANFHRGFHPGAKITRNEKLQGMQSGTKRDIDICIRQQVGIQELLIVVECKKRSRPVTVPEIDSFVRLKEDVAAHSGVMVNEKGFSKGALLIAKKNGIQVLTFQDTKKKNWLNCIEVPVLLELRLMMPIRITFQPEGGDESPVDPNVMEIDDHITGRKLTIKQMIKDQWYIGVEPAAGRWLNTYPAYNDNRELTGQLRHWFIVEKKKYVSRKGLDFIGLVDHHKGVAHLNSFETPEILLVDIDKNWKRLDDDKPDPPGFFKVMLKTIMGATQKEDDYVPVFPDIKLSLSGTLTSDKTLPVSFKLS